jgi:hypothetical protein
VIFIKVDTGADGFFIPFAFIKLPTRSQAASGTPIKRQWWCTLTACHAEFLIILTDGGTAPAK